MIDLLAEGRATILSLQDFCERIALVARLELPCILYLGHPFVDRVYRGIIRKIERNETRMNLSGDDFTLFLHQKNIESIWLKQDEEVDEQSLSIEIFGHHGSPITRILAASEGVGRAVWHDVMGNPTLAFA